ncbi:MAG: HAD family hydrolase [Cyanobacteria bacterium RM1_2_2]|nr:HAD family hydrolase [Cyanobacteria bacterium RM1_2_2]
MSTIRCQSYTFENIRAIIFDKDGTLANSEVALRSLAQRRSRLIDAQIPGVQDPLLMAFGVNGDRIDPSGLMAIGTRLENEIAAAAYVAETGRGWVESLQIVQSAFTEADRSLSPKAEQTPLMLGALDLIQCLSQAGIRLAMLSSDSAANVREFLEVHALQPYFEAAYGVDAKFPTKTDAQLLQQLLLALAVPPPQVLVVGDSQVDVQVAKDAGLAGCIGFTGGWTTAPPIAGATVLAEQFSQIELTL